VTVLLKGSKAVTVRLKGTPAVATGGPLTAKWLAAAGLTRTLMLVPVIEPLKRSVAVMTWLPAVLRVTEKLPTPPINARSRGRTA